MAGMEVYKLTVTGGQNRNLGLRSRAETDLALQANMRKQGSGVVAQTNRGPIALRYDDIRNFLRYDDKGTLEFPRSLRPDSFNQSIVDPNLLREVKRIIQYEGKGKPLARYEAGQEIGAPIDWKTLKFSITPTDAMFVAGTKMIDDKLVWQAGGLYPFEDQLVSVAAGGLHYAVQIYEGLRAVWTADGHIALFRPERNAARFRYGAEKLNMPPWQEEAFLEAIIQVVLANKRWIPPYGMGSLYIRPNMFLSGEALGLPSTFTAGATVTIYVSPIAPYFANGLTQIPVLIPDNCHRSASCQLGDVKAGGNYALTLKVLAEAYARHYKDVLFLDMENKKAEELSASNFFCVIGDTIYTPSRKDGTILEGVTRDSLLQIARTTPNLKVVEGDITLDMLRQASEAIATGTAVVVASIGKIDYKGETIFNQPTIGPITRMFYERLTGIQEGHIADPFGWVRVIA